MKKKVNPGILPGFANLTHPKILTSSELDSYMESDSWAELDGKTNSLANTLTSQRTKTTLKVSRVASRALDFLEPSYSMKSRPVRKALLEIGRFGTSDVCPSRFLCRVFPKFVLLELLTAGLEVEFSERF